MSFSTLVAAMIHEPTNLTTEQITETYAFAEARWQAAKEKFELAENDFYNHMCGAFAEVAVEMWLREIGQLKDAPYRSHAHGFGADLILIDDRGVDVKAVTHVYDKVRYPVSQQKTIREKRIDLVLWCFVLHNPQSWLPAIPERAPLMVMVRLERWASADMIAMATQVEADPIQIELAGADANTVPIPHRT